MSTAIYPLPVGTVPYPTFAAQPRTEEPIEEGHPQTVNLSQEMHSDLDAGLRRLMSVDEAALHGLESFIPTIQTFSDEMALKVKSTGRIFLVGSGSMGRVATSLGALFGSHERVISIVAGGNSTFVEERSEFVYSEESGKSAIGQHSLTHDDVVIFLSPTHTSPFSRGAAVKASDSEAKTICFYTQLGRGTFALDIGPEAILGSNRLRDALLTQAVMGVLLATTFYKVEEKWEEATNYPQEILERWRTGDRRIREQISQIVPLVTTMAETLLAKRGGQDRGCVTFLAGGGGAIRAVWDCIAAFASQFSTGRPCRDSENPLFSQRPAITAYMAGENDNRQAWCALVGKEQVSEKMQDQLSFCLASGADSPHSWALRPKGEGNFVIGVASEGAMSVVQSELASVEGPKGILPLEVEKDPFGLSETLVLTELLNLLFNGSMILANKVFGNRVIELNPSSDQEMGRCIRLIQSIYKKRALSNEEIYHLLLHIKAEKVKRSDYTPSAVKIALAMLKLGNSFQGALDRLQQENESIAWTV